MNPSHYPMNWGQYAGLRGEPREPRSRVIFVTIQQEPPLFLASNPFEAMSAAMAANSFPAWFDEGAGTSALARPCPPGPPPACIQDAEIVEERPYREDARREHPKRRVRRQRERGAHAEVPGETAVSPLLEARVVRMLGYGEFKRLLAGQLAHPERAGDGDQIQCSVQVFEAASPLPPVEVARAIHGGGKPEGQFCLLTRGLAERLQLTGLVARAEPPAIRFVHVTVMLDPTAKQSAATAPPPPQPEALKTAVPERFVKPWEFRFTREEALYDMAETQKRSGISAFLARLARWRRGAAEIRKWHTLLQGKSAEDQLWAVRPPAAALADPEVKRWVSETLASCGYAPEPMLAEWEIYWRRKGL